MNQTPSGLLLALCRLNASLESDSSTPIAAAAPSLLALLEHEQEMPIPTHSFECLDEKVRRMMLQSFALALYESINPETTCIMARLNIGLASRPQIYARP